MFRVFIITTSDGICNGSCARGVTRNELYTSKLYLLMYALFWWNRD